MLYDANIKLIQILCYLETQILIDFVLFMADFQLFRLKDATEQSESNP
jgi:hypothetical protein